MTLDPMSPWYGMDDVGEIVVPSPQVDIIYNEVEVGTILGPDGEPIHTVFSRPRFPFGFNLS